MWILLAGALLSIHQAYGYSSGADPTACLSMVPGHGFPPQTSPSPYSITVNSDRYAANGVLTVTLSGTTPLKGFLVMARKEDGSPTAVGTFQSTGNTAASLVQDRCSGGSTHTQAYSGSPSNRVELQWNAPSSIVGNIVFYATFVQSYNTFWTKVQSKGIWDGVGSSPALAAPTAAAPVVDGPQIAAVTLDGCGTSKSCYNDCKGNVCSFILTWKKVDANNVDFELFATGVSDPGYAAVGFSPVNRMEDVTVIACMVDAGTTTVKQFYAASKSGADAVSAGAVSSSNSSYKSSEKKMTCRFRYDNSVKGPKTKDLDKPLYAFIARGNAFGGTINKHANTPIISPQVAAFSATTFVVLSGTSVNALAKAHGVLMILAWVLCASTGIMLARYYKPMWSNTKACGQKVWFSYHRALMLTCMFLTLISIILIFVDVRGYSGLDQLPQKAHPILGIIVLICSVLNPILAAFRCHPGTKNRPFFNWFHWFFGTVGHIFAIIAIFIGMMIQKADVPAWLTYVMMAWCLFHVIVEFILEIHQCCMYDRNRDRQESFQMNKSSGNTQEPDYVGRGFKSGMLAFYLIVTVILTIIMVIFVAINGTY